MTAPEADLTGWSAEPFTGGGYTHDVYRRGDGPGVVLIPEVPGIHPGVLGLGNHLVDNGFTVAIPSLFGECFTGGFALAAAVDDAVLAPVLSQPSVPFPLTPRQRRDPGVSDLELNAFKDRAVNEGLCAIGLRFSEDRMSPGERFTTLKERLGDAFEVIEIDSRPGNEHGF